MEGLERQTRPPDDVVAGPGPAAALAGGASWFWLIEDSVVAESTALEALMQALEGLGPLPEPALLASKVVTPDGLPVSASLPVVLNYDADMNVAAFERYLVRIRIARRGSLLVHRRALTAHGLPPRNDILWSARLLKAEPGLLVPASVAVRRPADGETGDQPAPLEALDWSRLLLSGALAAVEKPWFAFRLLESVVSRLRASSGSVRRP